MLLDSIFLSLSLRCGYSQKTFIHSTSVYNYNVLNTIQIIKNTAVSKQNKKVFLSQNVYSSRIRKAMTNSK